ncbi:hypothetical protein [Halomarina oriensis]|uniref:TraB family protein n=1 Tax=Halomarina oriensis TaxID=671145 RepID=A0A6B0GNR7_9EURY|nr:hypothetical protein [Halomarina oriensis]MWG33238.1 hypothetical protein [Halomarina oriensis]
MASRTPPPTDAPDDVSPDTGTGPGADRESPPATASTVADERHCRHVVRPDGSDLLVVGVVHDHPASVARVRRICRRVDPDTLALELPRASLPLYRRFAATDPPETGGEMSAAIAAAPAARLVSADPLDSRLLFGLVRETHRTDRSWETVRAVADRTLAVTRNALGDRLAALSPEPPDPPEATTYGCEDATPEAQADHEADHVSRCSLLAGATVAPPAVRITDAVRERRMARRLAAVDGGTVVAVVGWSHLDPVVGRLDA